MVFKVLGSFEVALDGRPVRIGGPQLRTVLARLVVDAGRRVSVAALVDELWGHQAPPPDAERTARTYVSRLRRVLPDHLLATVNGGYELRVGPDAIDAGRFERLATAGRRALERGEAAAARRDLDEALALWRGDAYADFAECPVLAGEGARLDRLRLAVIEDQVAAALAAGADGALVDDLESLVRAHPLRERLWGHLMVALYRSGRQAEALAAFRDARAVLADEHGVEPSPELAEIHRQVLNQDPALARELAERPSMSGTTIAAVGVPAQLPMDVRDFTGRRPELSELDRLADDPSGGVVVMTGSPGVGKTSLAVHFGHRVADRFPDGQLYVDLRGFAAEPPVDPADALKRMLAALGVTAIPSDVDDRVALYRSILAGKRVLVVVDNAGDAAAARPLLPGSPGSMAVVTSRSSLTALVASAGAHRLRLDPLSLAEARELFNSRLSGQRVENVDAIAEGCAGLPLALAVAAARPGSDPGTSAELDTAFSWSHEALSAPAARLLRLYGNLAGPDLTVAAAASLTALDATEARSILVGLVDAGLLTEHRPGRYAGHELLRRYSARLSTTVDSFEDRAAAARRLVDHHLHTSHAAARTVGHAVTDLPAPVAGAVVARMPDRQAAWRWLEAEHECLCATQRLAAGYGWVGAVWRLAQVMDALHQRRGADLDAYRAWNLAKVQDDPEAAALVMRRLGETSASLGHHAEAEEHLNRAAGVAAAAGLDRVGARIQSALAEIWSRRGSDRAALPHALRALELFRRGGDAAEVAAAADRAGRYAASAGDTEIALTYLRTALRLSRQLGDRPTEQHALHGLGQLAQRSGRPDRAVRWFGRSLALIRAGGNIHAEASTLDSLGDAHAALRHPDQARQAWQRAELLCEAQARHDDADRVRDKLSRLAIT